MLLNVLYRTEVLPIHVHVCILVALCTKVLQRLQPVCRVVHNSKMDPVTISAESKEQFSSDKTLKSV